MKINRRCFKCEKQLKSARMSAGFDDRDDISDPPDDGTFWTTPGNWGSSVFDSLGESYLEMYICDDCLRTNAHLVYQLSEYPVRKEVKVEEFKP